MYCFVQFCRVCIRKDGNLIDIENMDEDAISFYDKLKFCQPNIVDETPKMHRFICEECTINLRKVYNFHKLYTNSELILKGYFAKLTPENTETDQNVNSFSQLNSEDDSLKKRNFENPVSNVETEIVTVKVEPCFIEEDIDSKNDSETDIEENENFVYSDNLLNFECSMKITNENDGIIENVDFSSDAEQGNVKDQPSSDNSGVQNRSRSEHISKQCEVGPVAKVKVEKRFVCEICTKPFKRPQDLRRHAVVHTREKPYMCEICKKWFKYKNNMIHHRCLHQDQITENSFREPETTPENISEETTPVDKRYTCELCVKSFKTSRDLRRHALVHTGVKSYTCDICDKAFKHLRNLKHHQYIHSDTQPFECEICFRRFSNNSHLKRHRVVHSEIKPFVCKTCSKGFNRVYNLTAHELTHSSSDRYSCDLCFKNYSSAEKLEKHKFVHSVQSDIFHCDVCDESFDLLQSFKEHQLMHSDKRVGNRAKKRS